MQECWPSAECTKKTKVVAFNTDDAAVSTKDGTVLKVVDRLQVPRGLHRVHRERAEAPEGTGLGHTAQYEKGVEVQPE